MEAMEGLRQRAKWVSFGARHVLVMSMIMTSIFFLADTFIQSDPKEDQEEHKGIHMEGLDLEDLD